MNREPLDHYRTLYVQPDAPPEVIKAAWRALMSARRVHPDLGGDHDTAVRLNAAYEVLGDPVRRAAYDHRPQGSAGAAHQDDPSAGHGATPQRSGAGGAAQSVATVCPFCQRPHAGALRRDSRCIGCHSPLAPLPEPLSRTRTRDEHQGRRRDPRFARDAIVQLWLPGEQRARSARLQDLSFSGLQLHAAEPLPGGQVVRVVAPWFDALFAVVGSRRLRSGHALHGRLLTLLMQQQARGVYVNSRA
ncbi:MAG: DnaJ domain-containing protein [Hydrogenophaga sp.]|jgi:curved DNA-binding protein CbpA|nr:DnaJ domain-containing protein [Hydrogenophaga sp.]